MLLTSFFKLYSKLGLTEDINVKDKNLTIDKKYSADMNSNAMNTRKTLCKELHRAQVHSVFLCCTSILLHIPRIRQCLPLGTSNHISLECWINFLLCRVRHLVFGECVFTIKYIKYKYIKYLLYYNLHFT